MDEFAKLLQTLGGVKTLRQGARPIWSLAQFAHTHVHSACEVVLAALKCEATLRFNLWFVN